MGETSIEWCRRLRQDRTRMPGYSFNPWWGCWKISHACKACYADTFATRIGMADLWERNGRRRFFGDKHWNEPLRWNAKAAALNEHHAVFCASMADVGEDHPALVPHRNRLWDLIARTPNLLWLLLTKRPVELLSMVPWALGQWPSTVWLGVTVESPAYLWRAHEALKARASVTFVSHEPALEPVDFRPVLGRGKVEWLIVGTEQTHASKARTTPNELAANVIAQCRETGARPFVKQLDAGLLQLGRKGEVVSDLDKLPPHLRVREWPDLRLVA
jgi:protein gp37